MIITISCSKLLLTILLLIASALITWHSAKWYYTKRNGFNYGNTNKEKGRKFTQMG